MPAMQRTVAHGSFACAGVVKSTREILKADIILSALFFLIILLLPFIFFMLLYVRNI